MSKRLASWAAWAHTLVCLPLKYFPASPNTSFVSFNVTISFPLVHSYNCTNGWPTAESAPAAPDPNPAATSFARLGLFAASSACICCSASPLELACSAIFSSCCMAGRYCWYVSNAACCCSVNGRCSIQAAARCYTSRSCCTFCWNVSCSLVICLNAIHSPAAGHAVPHGILPVQFQYPLQCRIVCNGGLPLRGYAGVYAYGPLNKQSFFRQRHFPIFFFCLQPFHCLGRVNQFVVKHHIRCSRCNAMQQQIFL